MKNKLLLTSTVLSLVLLAGCTAEQSVPPSQNTQQNLATSSQANINQPTQQLSAADQAAYQGALQLKDPTFCDKISDANYSQQCKTAIVDQITLNDAVAKMDTSLCDKISTKDQQDVCKIQVEVLLKQKEDQQKTQQMIDDGQKLANTIIGSGDYTRCKTVLTLQSQIQDCEYNILANQAIKAKDISLCDKISLGSSVDACKTAYNTYYAGGTTQGSP